MGKLDTLPEEISLCLLYFFALAILGHTLGTRLTNGAYMDSQRQSGGSYAKIASLDVMIALCIIFIKAFGESYA